MNCSRCNKPNPLAKANVSRKTGERLYRSWCTTCEKERKDKWRATNLTKHNQQSKAWVTKNKEKRKQIAEKYAQTHKHIIKRRSAVRKQRFKNATPSWLSEWDLFYIEELYDLSLLRNLEVDHIIPLNGKNVCGLHVPTNLQLLTRFENRSKGNKFDQTY